MDKTYELSSFETNIDRKKLNLLRNRVVRNYLEKEGNPIFILVYGEEYSGKSAYIDTIFKDYDIDCVIKENLQMEDICSNILYSQYVVWFQHPCIFNEKNEHKLLKECLKRKKKKCNGGVYIFECNLYEYMPPKIKKMATIIKIKNEPFPLEKDKGYETETELLLTNKTSNNEKRIFDIDEFRLLYGFDCRFEDISLVKQTLVMDHDINLFNEIVAREHIINLINKTPKPTKLTEKRFKAIHKLVNSFPNIKQGKELILSMIENWFYLSKEDGCPANLLLIGPPGCGKTEFARRFSDIFQQTQIIIPIGSNGGITKLLGTTGQYKNAECGKIILSFGQANIGKVVNNPVVIIDEIEKGLFSGSINEDYNLEGTFCQILEKKNSKKLYDNFFRVNFDGSKIMYILTANYMEKIPETILSRTLVVKFREYTEEEICNVVLPDIYSSFCISKKSKYLPKYLPEETKGIISRLTGKQPRNIYLILERIAAMSRDTKSNFHSMVLNNEQIKSLENEFKNSNNNFIGFNTL